MGAVSALYAGILTQEQAALVGNNLEEKFQRPGGLATSLHSSDLMWDGSRPDYKKGERAVGFALDIFMAYVGLRKYEQHRLAFEIAKRWLRMNAEVYKDTGQFYENYDVNNCTPGYGGEKPVQSGFAWTNGVNLWLENQMIQAGFEPSLQ
jgi:alpha,alpha-trehalase